MQKVQNIYKDINREHFDTFIALLKKEGFNLHSGAPAPNSHHEVYKFVYKKGPLTTVSRDNKDNSVQIAAAPDISELIVTILKDAKSGKQDKAFAAASKALTKSYPNAFKYLSAQSKIYLVNTSLDLKARLSNYCGVLGEGYRGLEHLISGLERAQNINVKLIGQAFDKDEAGRYILRDYYFKRINSIVYAEVLSALYTAYFSERHYYTHSDNVLNEPRIISDPVSAQKEFDKLMRLLDYNCKKLAEINFVLP